MIGSSIRFHLRLRHVLLMLVASLVLIGVPGSLVHSTAAQAATFVSDSFTGTNGTNLTAHSPDTGGTWSKVTSTTGNITIQSNAAADTDNAVDGVYTNSAAPATADYDVQATITLSQLNAGNIFLLGRVQSGARTYYAGGWVNDGHWAIYKWISGSPTLVSQASATPSLTGHTVKLQQRGPALALIVDSVQTVTATDSSITGAGTAGLAFFNNTSTQTGTVDNFTAVDAVTYQSIAPNASGIFYSPYNWFQSGSSYALSNTPGAYVKTNFTGTSFGVSLDTTNNSSGFFRLAYSIDGGSIQSSTITTAATQNLMLATGLTSGTHSIQIWDDALATQAALYPGCDRWTLPKDAVKITGYLLDQSATVSTPTLKPKRMLVYGDSTSEGASVLGATDNVANATWTVTWVKLLADALNAEVGCVAYQAEGYEQTGQGNVPGLTSAWNLQYAGQSRTFSPNADYVFILHGTNGTTTTSDVTTMITNIRGQFANALIFVMVPFGQGAASTISSAVASQSDSKCYLLNLGSAGQGFVAQPTYSTDGTHPNVAGHTGEEGLILAAMNAVQTMPITVANLNPIGYYTADDLSGSDGSFVASWPDRTQNGNTGTSTAGSQGVVLKSMRGMGLNAWYVDWNATAGFVTFPCAVSQQNFTVIAVVAQRPDVASVCTIAQIGTGTAHNLYISQSGAHLNFFNGDSSSNTDLGTPALLPGPAQAIAVRGTGSAVTASVNGTNTSATAAAMTSATTAGIVLGNSNNTQTWKGWVYRYVVFPTALTDAQCLAASNALLADLRGTHRTYRPYFLADGNSISYGNAASPITNGFVDLAFSQAQAAGSPIQLLNVSIPSMKTTDLTSAQSLHLASELTSSDSLPILFSWEATNDIANGGASAATAFSHTQSYFSAARTAIGNAKLITVTGTIIARTGAISSGTQNTYNSSVLANMVPLSGYPYIYVPGNGVTVGNSAGQAVCDYVIDFASIPSMTFNADNVHPDNNGHSLLAAPLKSLMLLLASQPVSQLNIVNNPNRGRHRTGNRRGNR